MNYSEQIIQAIRSYLQNNEQALIMSADEEKRHHSELAKINGDANAQIDKANRECARKCTDTGRQSHKIIDADRDELSEIAKVEDILSQLMPRQKVDFSFVQKKPDETAVFSMDKAVETLSQLNERGFRVGLKKIFSVGGYVYDDQAAGELYLQIDARKAFLNKRVSVSESLCKEKIQSFESACISEIKKINDQKEDLLSREEARHCASLGKADEKLRALLTAAQFDRPNQLLANCFDECQGNASQWKNYTPSDAVPRELLLGKAAYRCSNMAQPKEVLQKVSCYNGSLNAFVVPVTVSTAKPLFLLMEETVDDTCDSATICETIAERIIQFYPKNSFRLVFFDPADRGASLGNLIQLTPQDNGCGVCKYYLSSEKITETLKQIEQHVDEVCKKLTSRSEQSIYSYNDHYPDEAIPFTFMILHDYPRGLNATALAALQIITEQAVRCGISIMISCKKNQTLEQAAEAYLSGNRAKFSVISSVGQQASITLDNTNCEFRPCPNNPSKEFFGQVNEAYNYTAPMDNTFSRFFPQGEPSVQRQSVFGLDIPFAIDCNGNSLEYSIGYDCSPYGYICGTVGSGKTTLMRSLITSAMLHYSPEELELWLVDYKKTEFAFYINHCPEHVRYVVIDNSDEISYSVLDQITAEIARRAALFRAADVKDFVGYRANHKLPRIIVVIDEFHRMSQAVCSYAEYKTALYNVFAEARSSGITLLLGDQSFDSGVAALSDEAKRLISARIAMKHDPSVLRNVLGLTAATMTDVLEKQLLAESTGVAGSFIYRHELPKEDDNALSNPLRYEVGRAFFCSESEQKAYVEQINSRTDFKCVHTFYSGLVPTKMDPDSITQCELALSPKKRNDLWLYTGTPIGIGSCFGFPLRQELGSNIMISGSDDALMLSVLRSVVESARRRNFGVRTFVLHSSFFFKRNRAAFMRGDLGTVVADFSEICRYVGMTAEKLRKMNSDEADFEDLPDEENEIIIFVEADRIYKRMQDTQLPRRSVAEFLTGKEKAPEPPAPAREPDALNEQLRMIRQLLGEDTDESEPAQETARKTEGPVFSGYDATEDLAYLLENAALLNMYCAMTLNSPSGLSGMYQIKNSLSALFKHRIVFPMSPEEAYSLLSRTNIIKQINERGEEECAVYEYNGSRQQQFVPYLWEE